MVNLRKKKEDFSGGKRNIPQVPHDQRVFSHIIFKVKLYCTKQVVLNLPKLTKQNPTKSQKTQARKKIVFPQCHVTYFNNTIPSTYGNFLQV